MCSSVSLLRLLRLIHGDGTERDDTDETIAFDHGQTSDLRSAKRDGGPTV
jgi:hypothetical protein